MKPFSDKVRFSFEFIFLFPEFHENRMQEKKQPDLQNQIYGVVDSFKTSGEIGAT